MAARKLFADAVKDEDLRDFESALAKFRKVQAVKDTAAVRFRIGNCLENLGHLKEALASYRRAIEAAAADPNANQAEIMGAGRDRIEDLEKRLPALTLTLSQRAPTDSVVELDGQPLNVADLRKPVVVEPGSHVLTARGTGARPFETQVALAERARLALIIPLDPTPETPVTPATVIAPQSQPSQETSDGNNGPVGWILAGAGAALLVGAGITWTVRQSSIDTMNEDCPGAVCPEAKRDEVESARSRAQSMVPVTVGLGIGGAAMVGTGLYFALRRPTPRGGSGQTTKSAAITALPKSLHLSAGGASNAAFLRLGGAF